MDSVDRQTPQGSRAAQILVTAAALVIVIAGMKAAAGLLVQILLAVFAAVICAPVLGWMDRRGVRPAFGIVILMIVLVLVGAGIPFIFGTSLKGLDKDMQSYQQKLQDEQTRLVSTVNSILVKFNLGTIPDRPFREAFDPQLGARLLTQLLNGVVGAFSNAFVILLLLAFMLAEASQLPGKLNAAMERSSDALERAAHVVTNIRHYLAIKTVLSLATGVCLGVILRFLGVDYAELWGLLAFLLNYIPNIGSILAGIPAVLVALIQPSGGGGLAVGVTLVYLGVNVVLGSIIEPRWMGKGLGLSTLVVFVSLLFWGWVLGPVGMLLSAPLTMSVKIALESQPDTRWIAILLGSKAPAASG